MFSERSCAACKYNRMASIYLVIFMAYLAISIAYSIGAPSNFVSLFDPASMYQTADLWSKEGLSFWIPFMYETPAIAGRYFVIVMLPILVGLYFYYASKARKLKLLSFE